MILFNDVVHIVYIQVEQEILQIEANSLKQRDKQQQQKIQSLNLELKVRAHPQ